MNMSQLYDRLISGEMQPRYHTGVGFMQLYLNDTTRLHVWHPDLPQKLEAFGGRHNHRFDMSSTVLKGTVVDIGLAPIAAFHTGEFFLYEVVPAHVGDFSAPTRLDDIRYSVEMLHARRIEAGKEYAVTRRQYHESRAEGLTVTLVKKQNQEERHARILAHYTQESVHGMAHGIPQALLNQCFFSAMRKLDESAIKLIESEIENG